MRVELAISFVASGALSLLPVCIVAGGVVVLSLIQMHSLLCVCSFVCTFYFFFHLIIFIDIAEKKEEEEEE